MRQSHFFLFLFLSFFFYPLWAKEPSILYLTWKDDPTSTMVVIWHQEKEKSPQYCYYKKRNSRVWSHKESEIRALSVTGPYVHVAFLEGLEKNTLYDFYVQEEKGNGTPNQYFFRTLSSSLLKPLRVITGGDAFLDEELYIKMNRHVASRDPDFVILGGDLSYAEGLRRVFKQKRWKIERWQEFLRIWTQTMRAPSQRMIPLVPVVGNHDVQEGFDLPFKRKILFNQLFAFSEDGVVYRRMDIGPDLSFYLLDSGHISSIDGAQAKWLSAALAEKKKALYRIPVYHIGGYPTETSYHHRACRAVRDTWLPIFETQGIKIALENDSHTFKRTFCLKQGKMDPDGVYYLGDGCWGVKPEKVEKHWYLEKSASVNHYWQLTIDRTRCRCQAFDIEGKLLDQLDISAVGAGDGAKSFSNNK